MAFQTPHNLVISDEQLDMSAKNAVLLIGTFSGFNHEKNLADIALHQMTRVQLHFLKSAKVMLPCLCLPIPSLSTNHQKYVH